jgi:hypothetical protein
MTTLPVLFLIFNRPALTQRMFARIWEDRLTKLFIVADGPRPGVIAPVLQWENNHEAGQS